MALLLVADDDEDIRELVRLRMTSWGHEVIAVPDGEAALVALREHPVELAILDVMMPRLNGYDVLVEQRAHEIATGASRLPVLMMSARCQRADVAEAYRLGADEYIVKPFTLSHLTTVASKMVALSPVEAGRATA